MDTHIRLTSFSGAKAAAILTLSMSLFYCSIAHADLSSSKLQGTQLAYFIGYHSYSRNPVVIKAVPVQPIRGTYWTRWKYIGFSCYQSCLIDTWTGLNLQCRRRC
ncbi:hypothetical protein ELY21_10330 [Legionella sp. km535]|uniref:hypothetical protein n=1 Tax=Legionella sp. km535 TaxID=2498107 RepID=UPI000F8D8544|nr:hypothetical protein [Legionella sp. km535]RUR17702.1 hypothetical protein ELY21_10330 [Legionella sp. km535]